MWLNKAFITPIMKRFSVFSVLILHTLLFTACKNEKPTSQQLAETMSSKNKKTVVYQVFTRLFGNTQTTYTAWGTPEQNGLGKFNHFTDKALEEIKKLGVTHIWYTGVPHHALINDYTAFGISNDDPDVVKGRAGSPYAVKDYYNVNPDLAVDPDKRLEEFEALIARTHQHGLKVIIDIVPNHVARHYESLSAPEGISGFGANDDTTVEYRRDNNFYYIPGQSFKVPQDPNYQPLGGQAHPLSDGHFDENPAKWTGNGSRAPQPHIHDWYETVKVNYGIRPDGTKDFQELPENYRHKGVNEHFAFWQDKDVPDSWVKFKDIALYWLDKGVDGFRYDMAEMVPVEFWSYMNAAIKHKNPEAFLLAEVYNPAEYRNYLQLGKMDYLYDKVELYDTLKAIIQNRSSTDYIADIQDRMADIEHHMLHFLENHDEQRIASPEFAGDPFKALPAMVVSATISTSPTMIYFGQEVGEPGSEDAGFGKPSRTSIFDYIGVPHHQRWMNNGAFDGGQLSAEEFELRSYYQKLLNLTLKHPAFSGEYREIHRFNRANTQGYDHKLFSFVRWSEDEKLIVVTNFDAEKTYEIDLQIPTEILQLWSTDKDTVNLTNLLGSGTYSLQLPQGKIEKLHLSPLESVILKWN